MQKTWLTISVLLSVAILCVGLFFAAAQYANSNFENNAEANATPATDSDMDTSISSDFDSITDTEEGKTEDILLPLHGEEYSTSPLPQWCDQYAFIETMIAIAESQPVDAEDEKGVTIYGTYFGDPAGQWCTEFALWCVIQAQETLGVEYINRYYPYSDYSGGCISWYKKNGNYRTPNSYVPRRGDMIFFEYDGDNVTDHTGLVTGVEYCEEDGKLYVLTIEGNLPEDYPKGVIRQRRLAVDDPLIYAYGTFQYSPKELPTQGDAQ